MKDIKPFWSDDNPEPYYSAEDASAWVLFRAPPNRERQAEQAAKRGGQKVIVPMVKQTKRKTQSRKRFALELPLINQYVFVGDPDWLSLLRIPIIGRPVFIGGELCVMSQADMSNILALAKSDIPIAATPRWRKTKIEPGILVDIKQGLLQDTRMQVASVGEKEAELIFGKLRIKMHLENLEAVA